MKKPRRGAKGPPAAPPNPPVQLSTEALLAERGKLRAVLRRYGVPDRDLDDVLQECLLGAIVASRAGRYQPNPAMNPREALQRWLTGIAFRQATTYRRKSYRRWEVAIADPLVLVADQGPCPDEQLEARATLRALHRVPPRERTVLVMVGTGELGIEIAQSLGVPEGTAFSRLRRGRERLATVLKRWRRGR